MSGEIRRRSRETGSRGSLEVALSRELVLEI